MPVKMTKKAINALLVAERKKSLLKQKNSKFMSRTLSIYSGQKARAAKLGLVVGYTIEEFREQVKEAIDKSCHYCSKKVTISNMTCDHATPVSKGGKFELDNNRIVCTPCNLQKGTMDEQEWESFMSFISSTLISKESAEDIRRRLTLGGKWASSL